MEAQNTLRQPVGAAAAAPPSPFLKPGAGSAPPSPFVKPGGNGGVAVQPPPKAQGNGAHTRCPKCLTMASKEASECPACRTLLFREEPTPEERSKRIGGYSLGQLLMREREVLFEAIHREDDLGTKLRYYANHAYLFAALYGALLGVYSGWQYAPVVAAKMPILLFGTLIICAPALFTFDVLLGSRLTFRQTVTMLVSATYLTSVVMASLAPIILFFTLSGSTGDFVVLLSVLSCAIAGGFGVHLLWGGMRYLTVRSGREPSLGILKLWMLIYMFVGTQLAWTLRPFVNESGRMVLFRHLEGDFYSGIFGLLGRMLGGW